jgi:hypothetical protein
MSKSIFIRNKRRALRDALGQTEKWMPEHERLNMTPITSIDASEDFMNEKRRKAPIGSRKPPAAVHQPPPPGPPVVGSTPQRTRAVGPAQQEQAWMPQRPQQVPEKDYSHGDVGYDDVPGPPQNEFEHPYRALGVDLSGVAPGQYCLIYENEAWPSDSLEEIEAAVEQIMRSDPGVQDDDVIIIKRLGIKVGVAVYE